MLFSTHSLRPPKHHWSKLLSVLSSSHSPLCNAHSFAPPVTKKMNLVVLAHLATTKAQSTFYFSLCLFVFFFLFLCYFFFYSLIFLCDFCSPILLMAEYRYEEYYDGSMVPVCLTQASNIWTITYFLMTISAFFILPLFILVILYTIIAKNLISKDGRMVKIRPSKPELSFKARKQVVLMLGAVVLSFFVCLLPFRIFTLWIIAAPDDTVKGFGLENYYNCLYFSRIMLYLNSAVNPILYNLMSSKFRKGFRKLCFSCLWSPHRQRTGRGRLATLNNTTTTTTTTTTTSSFNSHSVARKARTASGRTISLDDLRNSNYSPSKLVDGKARNEWRRCNALGEVVTTVPVADDSSHEFRKKALRNATLLRQKSSLSSTTNGSGDEEYDTIKGAGRADDGERTSSNGMSVRVITLRQISTASEGGDIAKMHKKKKLHFQYSLDEEKAWRSQNNRRCRLESDDSQTSSPFLS